MQRQLASLALNPKVTVQLLRLVQFNLAFNEDTFLLGQAGIAHNISLSCLQDVFATHARLLNNRELPKTRASSNLGLVDRPRVLSAKQLQFCFFRIFKNWLKNPDQRKFNLVFDIINEINRYVMFQYVNRVLRFFVGFRPFSSFYDYVRNSITNCWRRSGIPLLHLFSQLDVRQVRIISNLSFLVVLLFLLFSISNFLRQTFGNNK